MSAFSSTTGAPAREGKFERIMREQEKVQANSADGVTPSEYGEQTLHVAVVYGVNEVRYLTAAASRAALAVRLAAYVRQHAANQLWPVDARRLRRLLAARQYEAAVEHYFASVGGRWDEERLMIKAIDMGPGPGAAPLPVAARHSNGGASAVQR
jgi:hypothetical protein